MDSRGSGRGTSLVVLTADGAKHFSSGVHGPKCPDDDYDDDDDDLRTSDWNVRVFVE